MWNDEMTSAPAAPQVENSALPVAPVKKRFSLPSFKFARPSFSRRGKILLSVFFVILMVILFFGLVSARFISKVNEFTVAASNLKAAGESQDLEAIKVGFAEVKAKGDGVYNAYRPFLVLKIVPIVSGYVSDGEHALEGMKYGFEAGEIGLSAMEPYSDILGFNKNAAEGGKDGEKTAQERIDFIVGSIPELIPKVDALSTELTKARGEIEKINPNRYPEDFFGKEVKEPLSRGIKLVQEADNFVVGVKPLLAVSPYLLGSNEKRTYLVLFQNDKELRPTGGFLTAYSIAEVEKGKFNPVASSDIYSLDAKYKPSIPAPQPILDYIQGVYKLNKNYKIRDINWSPDFRETIELFLQEAAKAGIEKIDGVIAVDTHLLVNLLKVLGPIGVPGYGNFSTEITPKCNCPQVIYELESFADVEGPIVWDPLNPNKIIYAPANFDNRKKIIGPLMNSILANALAQQKEKIPALFEAVYKSINEKHVLMYLHEDKAQDAAETFGIAGRIKETQGDYLHINDANLGGRKSNLYVTQEVKQNIEVAGDGSVTKTLEITYQNPQSYDGWLNSVLPNWTRIYLPKGSEILDVTGFEQNGETVEELGKTVVSGGFKLRPLGVAKITVNYKLPMKFNKNYSILIQKQPGTDLPLYTIEIGGKTEEFYLEADKKLDLSVN